MGFFSLLSVPKLQDQLHTNKTPILQTNLEVRKTILNLEQQIRAFYDSTNQTPPEYPVSHYFAPGMYGRELFVPKGTIVVAKIHKHTHLAILLQGHVTVATEEGIVDYVAPVIMVSKAGTKRAAYIHEDTRWVTIHCTTSTDLDIIEEEVIAKTYEEFDSFTQTIVHKLVDYVNP